MADYVTAPVPFPSLGRLTAAKSTRSREPAPSSNQPGGQLCGIESSPKCAIAVRMLLVVISPEVGSYPGGSKSQKVLIWGLMMRFIKLFCKTVYFLGSSLLIFPSAMPAQNQVLGEVQLVGKTSADKTSGVWIDGQYVGYVK